MKSVFFLLLFLIHTAPFWAQMHDNTWILGYGRPRTDFLIGLTKLTFEDGTIKMDTIQNPGFGYYHNNSAFSDDKGDLIAYFDGNDIMNKQYEFMENGKGMNKEIIENNYYLSSEFMSQASVMIPWPGHPDSILVLYSSLFIIATPDMTDVVSLDLSMAVINRKSNNNDGKLIIRDSILLKDTIQSGRLNPIRHANGRDWWLLISERGHNRFYTILIDPQGPKIVGQPLYRSIV